MGSWSFQCGVTKLELGNELKGKLELPEQRSQAGAWEREERVR